MIQGRIRLALLLGQCNTSQPSISFSTLLFVASLMLPPKRNQAKTSEMTLMQQIFIWAATFWRSLCVMIENPHCNIRINGVNNKMFIVHLLKWVAATNGKSTDDHCNKNPKFETPFLQQEEQEEKNLLPYLNKSQANSSLDHSNVSTTPNPATTFLISFVVHAHSRGLHRYTCRLLWRVSQEGIHGMELILLMGLSDERWGRMVSLPGEVTLMHVGHEFMQLFYAVMIIVLLPIDLV